MNFERAGMANEILSNAKRKKHDEFYTQYSDIEKEMNAYLDFDASVFKGKVVLLPCDDPEWSNFTKYFAENFDRLGLKKLISTSYAPDSKPSDLPLQLTLFEQESPKFDTKKTRSNGRIFTLERDGSGDRRINFEDLEWDYLKGDGDFRSEEVRALRDEADIIVTNPPFSLFRYFLAWIMEADKKFVIVGNQNAITYKEVFPLIKENKVWLGNGFTRNMAHFYTPYVPYSKWIEQEGDNVVRVAGVQWFTNVEHGKRHEPLKLMTEAENKKFSKHGDVKGVGYLAYDNYDAIDVPHTDAIPSDCPDAMGVPITFLNKYNPDQFEILGCTESEGKGLSNGLWDEKSGVAQPVVAGERKYKRIFIKHKGLQK